MSRLLSVLIDTYNHEKYVEQAVVSAIEQDFPAADYEIVVVDDGSTDRTPEIVRKFAPRVQLMRKKNGGQASAFNVGISETKGPLVALLDGDDTWLPGKLTCVAKEFEVNPSAVMVYHRCLACNPDEGRSWDWPMAEVSGDVLADRRKLVMYGGSPTSSLAFRRGALERMMPVPESLAIMADAFLVGTAVFLGPVIAIADCLTRYRVHGQNLWFAGGGEGEGEVIRRRMKARRAAMVAVGRWVRENGSPSWIPKARTLLRSWQMMQDQDEFRINPPDRFRYFVHRSRMNLLYGGAMTPGHRAYNWAHTVAELILGREHSHYLEGVRTRARKLLLH